MVSLEKLASTELLQQALEKVRANRGAPGVDGVTIETFSKSFHQYLPALQSDILCNSYKPGPVRVMLVSKPSGGSRKLGIPTVQDRCVLQALNLLLTPVWEPFFSPRSFAYRPGLSAHDAIAVAQTGVAEGSRWVLDLDIEAFFDNVDHVRLMLRLAARIDDAGILDLIADFLRAGRRWPDGTFEPSRIGLAQGSPLSPLLANIVLDELDHELERRKWNFVRYADDCIILAESEGDGRNMLGVVETFLKNRLGLRLHPGKTRVVSPEEAVFLGFTYRISRYGRVKRHVSAAAIAHSCDRIDAIMACRKEQTLEEMIRVAAVFLRGWIAYYGFAEDGAASQVTRHARARLRAWAWQSWRTPEERMRQLILRGVPPAEAETAAFSLQFSDSISDIPALVAALPNRFFAGHGLDEPRRVRTRSRHSANAKEQYCARLLTFFRSQEFEEQIALIEKALAAGGEPLNTFEKARQALCVIKKSVAADVRRIRNQRTGQGTARPLLAIEDPVTGDEPSPDRSLRL